MFKSKRFSVTRLRLSKFNRRERIFACLMFQVFLFSLFLGLASPSQALAQTATTGKVKSWGDNFYGQLGNSGSTTPTDVLNSSGGTLSNISRIAGGSNFSLALNGTTLYVWGDNSFGQLGTGNNNSQNLPVSNGRISSVKEISAGRYHSLALKTDGTVWSWGDNFYGQLGNNTTTSSNVPVQVSGLSGVTQIAAGYDHSIALKSDGTVWAWGNNFNGELGNGTYDQSNLPVRVSTITGVTQISVSASAGYDHNLAVGGGLVYAWGSNTAGQLGNGTNTASPTPVQVSGLSGVSQVAAGSAFSIAAKSDGTVWSWGDNTFGQLGLGNTTNQNTPAQVNGGLSGVSKISAGEKHVLAQKSSGSVHTWGDNGFGQLGTGNTDASSVPMPATSLSGAIQIAAGHNHSLAIYVPDTQAPTAPTSLVSTGKTSTTVSLSWNASTDNVSVVSYDIYRDSNLAGNATGTTFTVTGLTSNTAYSFSVRAKDAAGNLSPFSNTISVTPSQPKVLIYYNSGVSIQTTAATKIKTWLEENNAYNVTMTTTEPTASSLSSMDVLVAIVPMSSTNIQAVKDFVNVQKKSLLVLGAKPSILFVNDVTPITKIDDYTGPFGMYLTQVQVTAVNGSVSCGGNYLPVVNALLGLNVGKRIYMAFASLTVGGTSIIGSPQPDGSYQSIFRVKEVGTTTIKGRVAVGGTYDFWTNCNADLNREFHDKLFAWLTAR
jgi:alpha-tubulin suppressor-like RCC1 family protein